MTEILTDLLSADLIEKLGGNDDLFAKIEKAAGAVAEQIGNDRPQLIRAVLAGLDPDIPADDPAIALAEQALTNEWKMVRGVFTDNPVNLHRAILLAACHQAADDNINASILWLTAADTLPILRLGHQEQAVRGLLEAWAGSAEEHALASSSVLLISPKQTPIKIPKPVKLDFKKIPVVDKKSLLPKVAAAVFQNLNGNAVDNPNRYQPHNNPQAWAGDFATRMTDLLAGELDSLSSEVDKFAQEANGQLQVLQAGYNQILNSLNDALNSQGHKSQPTEQRRLNALWWSQALYSPSLRCGYRELPMPLAAVVMACDLLAEVPPPTPASVGYLLAETVNQLPEVGFDRKLALPELLAGLRDARDRLAGWGISFIPASDTGRLSLRDLAVLALTEKSVDLDAALQRAGVCGDFKMSLPQFARALFRQEQAVRLAAEAGQ